MSELNTINIPDLGDVEEVEEVGGGGEGEEVECKTSTGGEVSKTDEELIPEKAD